MKYPLLLTSDRVTPLEDEVPVPETQNPQETRHESSGNGHSNLETVNAAKMKADDNVNMPPVEINENKDYTKSNGGANTKDSETELETKYNEPVRIPVQENVRSNGHLTSNSRESFPKVMENGKACDSRLVHG